MNTAKVGMDSKSQQTLEFHKILARLADYTSFSASRELAEAVRPTIDADLAERWQAETAEAARLLDKRPDLSVGGARDVREAAKRALRGYILQPDDLLSIAATVAAGRELRRKLIKLAEQYPHLGDVAELIEECPGIVSAIGQTLNERGEVMDGASPALGDIRRQQSVVHDRIQEKLRSLFGSSQSQYLQEPTITIRSGRYVVPLKANYKGRVKGIVHDQSNSGATLWIEPFNTVELNNDYRRLQLEEEEEIQRILADLSAKVADVGEPIQRVVDRLAELDLIFARAKYALALKAVRPIFVPWRELTPRQGDGQGESTDEARSIHPGSTVWIRAARHPLLDPDLVVPTDLLVQDDVFIVLITGPNTGGKTVSLKTMGLMALMAQSGLHLPAVEARLSVFEGVFADIGDEQSIEQNLSTFSAHMNNIVRILARVSDRSLVLLDELGSGTDPAEGAALAQSIVEYLRDTGATTFVATHYPELKVYASQTAGVTNASLLFDVDTLMPTYEMTIGMPGRSNALAIARRLGLDETILDDAMSLVGAGSQRAESLLDSIYDIREKISSQEAGTRLALREAETAQAELEQRLSDLEQERQEILSKARRQAEEELKAARVEITEVRRQLRDAESRNQLKKLRRQTEETEEKVAERLAADEQERQKRRLKPPPTDLQPGDIVLVTTLGTRGEVLEADNTEAMVSVGRVRTRVPIEYLELKERAEEVAEEEAEPLPVGKPQVESPGMELDLRGQRVDEGLTTLSTYLENAFLANLPWVRIIHGKGTGRLRDAVRQALTSSAHVISWEEGKDGEGGAGVTIAKLTEE
ncbi:MAG: Smr/MutS family protein [Candidatus Promineifilaceae bacterium]|nr:Smr/MutS family protein [Candidatus Promineifilaceae bacterium]